MKNRKRFVEDIFEFLRDKDYVNLKYIEDEISSIGDHSDVDLAVTHELSKQIMSFLDQYQTILYYETYSYSFMNTVYIFFNDGSFIQLDLIEKFVRKQLQYLDLEEILGNSYIDHEGVKLSIVEYNFLNIFLFYVLNKQNIAKKYEVHFVALPYAIQARILKFVNERFSIDVERFVDLFVHDNDIHRSVTKAINRSNGLLLKIGNIAQYPRNIYTNAKKSKIITLSGVRGPEAITISNKMAVRLGGKYRRNVTEIRNFPVIFSAAISTQFGGNKADTRLSSLRHFGMKIYFSLRFACYLAKYVLRLWLVFVKHGLRGDIVIYDRSYDEIFNDVKGLGRNVDGWLFKLFHIFVFRPDVNVSFVNHSAVLVNGALGMNERRHIDQIDKYSILFVGFETKSGYKYSSIENIDKELTKEIIDQIYSGIGMNTATH